MGIVQRLAGFFFVPLNGIMSGGSTIVGQNLGAQQVERAEQTAKVAAGLGVGSMTALSLLVAAFPAQLLRLFTADADVIAMGCTIIYVLLPMLIIAGFAIGLATALVGAGYNFPFLISGVVSRWAVQLPFLFICVQVLQLPFVYAALSFTVAEVAGSSILIVAYLRGRWRTWRVTKPAEQRAETATA
jgi:Na+-driven multidrug efflux pump